MLATSRACDMPRDQAGARAAAPPWAAAAREIGDRPHIAIRFSTMQLMELRFMRFIFILTLPDDMVAGLLNIL